MKYTKKIAAIIFTTLILSLLVSIPTASAIECEDINDEVGFGLVDCSESGDITSFSGFEGGLTPPTGEGLDTTLTNVGSAREFIVNTVNFALSFLGVIAMAIVIYGGFLYITAAGNEEQSGKGKKAITYAVAGILIIIVSFALVNTLLKFGGGTGEDREDGGSGIRGAGEEGSNIGQQTIYSLGAAAINGSLNDFIGAYKNLVTIDNLLKKIEALPEPSESPRESENKKYLSAVTDLITQIKTNSNPLSKTHIAAKNLLSGFIATTANSNLNAAEFENGVLKEKFERALNETSETAPSIAEASKQDFANALTGIGEKLNIVKDILGEVAEAPYNDVLQRGLVTEKDLERAFAGIDSTKTIGELFTDAQAAVTAAEGLTANIDNSELVINVVKSLDRFRIIIKNIEFVFVRIRATVREGNAPLIVELSGLESRDPTGETISDDRYTWDPDGMSQTANSSMGRISEHAWTLNVIECNTRSGATIICTYQQPGTYIVRLKIKSKDPSRVATGQAFLPITVLPSVARIALKATVGSLTEDLQKYEQDAQGKWRVVIDKREFQVTGEEAKNPGVRFDASGSKAGGGATISGFEWSFGDSSGIETTEAVTHPYRNKGKFPLKLEVTDTGNRKDRKLVNIAIGSIAARTQVTATEGEPDQLIEFDGSLSRSDKGSITSYDWKISEVKTDGTEDDITNFANKVSIIGEPGSSVLRVKFKTPGNFKVTLSVSDGTETAVHTDIILIKSRKPRANFTMRACPEDCPDSAKPSLIEVDAGNSFDPDNDALIFDWKIFSEQGAELERGSSFEVEGGTPLAGKEAKKAKLKFNRTGKYKIQLNVKDDLPQSLQQADVKEKTVEILSTVELAWASTMTTAKKLEDGVAHFTFNGSVKNATRAQIDFGDSASDEKPVELNASGSGTFEFTHDYTQAGSFTVTLRGISEEGNGENSIIKRVYVSGGEKPLAVIVASVDGTEIVLPDPTPELTQPAFEIIRNKAISFDARNSINHLGGTGGLNYSWDFGDQKRNTNATTQHSYAELSPEGSVYTVTLTVSDMRMPERNHQAQFFVKVISKKPHVTTLSLEKKTAGETTPIDVELTAEGATDPDGRITNYQFWYFNSADRERKLSVVDTTSNSATLTVETAGEENEEHEYLFCVKVTDNDNTTTECSEMFDDNQLPHLRVKNGPNKAPTAAFTVDRTTARVNESLTFTSSSSDEDGRIIQYIWDFDGDGFHNDNPTELSTVTHLYTRKSPQSGYRVKLKVIDDKNAAGFSQEIPVHVEPKSNPPVANFSYDVQAGRTVKFFDSSTADSANEARIVKWTWDFDTSQEFGCDTEPRPAYCNGDKADDADSIDQNPQYTFPASATYQVKLTVSDSDSNVSAPRTTIINVSGGSVGTSGGTGTSTLPLRAAFGTEPRAAISTIPNCTPSTSDECKKKIIHIPASSNGQDITLAWGNSTGDIISYEIDKNTWCDSNGDGDRSNDVDHYFPNADDPTAGTCTVVGTGAPGESCWTTNYQRYMKTGHPQGPGKFNALLRVIHRDGTRDTDNVEIIFDGTADPTRVMRDRDCNGNIPQNILGASLFKNLGVQNTILISLMAGVIVVLVGFEVGVAMRRGKRRNF